MNKRIIIILVGAVIVAVGIWFWSQKGAKETEKTPINRDAPLILFYGRECPHCKDLDKFIADNKIKSKVKFEELEIFHIKENSNFLLEKAKGCGIDEKDLGVPFFYANGKCLQGAPEIENFLKEEAAP